MGIPCICAMWSDVGAWNQRRASFSASGSLGGGKQEWAGSLGAAKSIRQALNHVRPFPETLPYEVLPCKMPADLCSVLWILQIPEYYRPNTD